VFALTFGISSTAPRRNKMVKKAKKTAKLHKGKKLEAQKPLKGVTHNDFSIVKHVDVASPST
jgi:hypothetical protein